LLLVGVFTLACQDSLVKLMSSETSFWQFQTLRSIGNVGFAVMLAGLSGSYALLRPAKWRAVLLRSSFLMICMFFFFSGAPFLTVAQMAAGLYTYPIFISLLAAPVLGEQPGRWRIGAMILGAIGAAIVLSPWQEDFSSVQILPVIAGFFFACNVLTLRRGCRGESPLALAFVVGLMFLICGLAGIAFLSIFPLSLELQESLPFVAIGWPELTLLVLGFALLSSVLNLTGNICLTRAYMTADASLLAPMDFVYLLFAALWSKLLFDQWPSTQALSGMVLIATAGIITAWREQIISRRKSL
ncbi:MAG: DMT family transporter, partial [Gammaproteobacteria bacterium]|nr:DMT family transporter [Gammaproteobacteria bacterium]